MKALLTATLLLGALSSPLSAAEIIGAKLKLSDAKQIENSFEVLGPMLKAIREDGSLSLFEGLPHQTWFREQLHTELETKKTVTRYGYPFYQAPNPVESDDTTKLLKALLAPNAFEPRTAAKNCGGFHPDFAMVWTSSTSTVEIHVCFGCHEIRAYSDTLEVYCDIDEAYEPLKQVLAEYQIQRPPPDLRKRESPINPFAR